MLFFYLLPILWSFSFENFILYILPMIDFEEMSVEKRRRFIFVLIDFSYFTNYFYLSIYLILLGFMVI